jgi:hypothetical protein
VQAKGINNIFKKVLPIQVQEASRIPNRLGQNRTFAQHFIIQAISTENRERILKAVREKKQIRNKCKPIKITVDFSTETLKARRAWSELNEIISALEYSTKQNYHSELMEQ